MVHVKPVSREIIDAWPIADAGLPVRVVNSVKPLAIHTVGELRKVSDKELMGLRSLGRVSLGHIHAFFDLCDTIALGKKQFGHIREVFDIFLDETEIGVLTDRYGLRSSSLKASRSFVTLQEIGRHQNKTRERIRQVEATAISKLQSHLATVCLRPFYDFFQSFIDNLGRAVSCGDMSPLKREEILLGQNPCGILLLLNDLHDRAITYYHGFFSVLGQDALEIVETRAVKILEKHDTPVHLDQLWPHVSDGNDPHYRRVTQVVLDHTPDITATTDERYFIHTHGIRSFIREVMRTMTLPAHYRAITHAVNGRIKNANRKGAGHILEMLNSDDECRRVERGMYTVSELPT